MTGAASAALAARGNQKGYLENLGARPELDVRLLDEDLQLLEALVLRHALLRDGHEVPVELVLMLGDDAVAGLVPKDTI